MQIFPSLKYYCICAQHCKVLLVYINYECTTNEKENNLNSKNGKPTRWSRFELNKIALMQA